MVEVALTNSVRTNLLALQRNAKDTGVVQGRLATGLKVKDAIDDPIKFFTAEHLKNKSGDFGVIKDNINQGISVLKTTLTGLKGLTKIAEQMKGLVNAARATNDGTERNRLEAEFNALYTQLDGMAKDAAYNGTNLLATATPDNLTVIFDDDDNNSLVVNGVQSDAAGLGFTGALPLDTDGEITTASAAVDAALKQLRTTATTIGSNQAILTARLNFTEDYMNRLLEGAGILTNADMNEEGANLLALQTRQQLALNSLSLSTNSERSVLNLFG